MDDMPRTCWRSVSDAFPPKSGITFRTCAKPSVCATNAVHADAMVRQVGRPVGYYGGLAGLIRCVRDRPLCRRSPHDG